MKELPSHLVSEDFYIWFNIKEKEEYYSTPLYLYNVLRKDTEKVRFIRRIKLFCKELTIYLKGLRGQLDGRGLLIDFIYVLKV